jgi:pentapeptide repeat protein
VIGLIVGGIAAVTVQFMAQLPRQREMVVVPQWLPRPLDIFRADLKEKWLAGVNLRDAYAARTNLEGTVLQDATLQRAKLGHADLQEATLWTTTVSLTRRPAMTITLRYRCRFCGLDLPTWIPVAQRPDGAKLLHHLGAMHPTRSGLT